MENYQQTIIPLPTAHHLVQEICSSPASYLISAFHFTARRTDPASGFVLVNSTSILSTLKK